MPGCFACPIGLAQWGPLLFYTRLPKSIRPLVTAALAAGIVQNSSLRKTPYKTINPTLSCRVVLHNEDYLYIFFLALAASDFLRRFTLGLS